MEKNTLDVGVPARNFVKKFVTFVVETPKAVSTALANRIEDELSSEMYWNDNICMRDVETTVTPQRIIIAMKLYGAGIEVEAGKPVTASYSRDAALKSFRNVVEQNFKGIRSFSHVRIAIMDGDAPCWEKVPLNAYQSVQSLFSRGLKRFKAIASAAYAR